MSSPNPALVSQAAARRLPRLALILFCAAYVLPGLFGRDPWKNADVQAFATMVGMAQGRSDWWAPMLGGVPVEAALLPYGLGALSVKFLGPWLGAPLAARVPFALLLIAVLVLTWYATYHLARTEAAQPLPWAFGGEAQPVDYARAIADGALLALMATLGLLQLGHETTPELGQLAAITLVLYGLAASPFRIAASRLAILVGLPSLAASGAPTIAAALAVVAAITCRLSSYEQVRRYSLWALAAGVLAVVVSTATSSWRWRVDGDASLRDVALIFRQLLWFLWPVWPLALWTLWRWRQHTMHRHVSVPLGATLVPLAASVAMGGSDRALMLAVPALAVLGAFALPTLRRSTAAAIDWFSVCFFTAAAIAIWVIYAAIQTGIPAKPAANVARLAPDFAPSFSWPALALATLGTLAWLWLVSWRAGRNRHPLWKSLVLPAGGVALCWLLAMTLWLPLLDHARSYRPLIQRIAQHVPLDTCIAAPGMPRPLVGALEAIGGWTVDARDSLAETTCDHWLRNETPTTRIPTPPGWTLLARIQRPADRTDITAVYRRLR